VDVFRQRVVAAASGIGILPVGSGNNTAGQGSDRLEAYPTDGVNSFNPQPQNDGTGATEAEAQSATLYG
jgi:hypothetical protein